MASKSNVDLDNEIELGITEVTQTEGITPPAVGAVLTDLADSAWNNTDFPVIACTELSSVIKGTGALTFGATAAQTNTDLNITVAGAVVGDPVILGIDNGAMPAGAYSYCAWVSALNNVTVRFINASAGSVTPGAGNFKITIIK